MKSFHTAILIDAPVSRVWSLLTDLPNWPRWNTTVDKVEGSIGLGSRVTVYATAERPAPVPDDGGIHGTHGSAHHPLGSRPAALVRGVCEMSQEGG